MSGLVEQQEFFFFLWAGCRGIKEDLRAHCDPFKFGQKSNSHGTLQNLRNIN